MTHTKTLEIAQSALHCATDRSLQDPLTPRLRDLTAAAQQLGAAVASELMIDHGDPAWPLMADDERAALIKHEFRRGARLDPAARDRANDLVHARRGAHRDALLAASWEVIEAILVRLDPSDANPVVESLRSQQASLTEALGAPTVRTPGLLTTRANERLVLSVLIEQRIRPLACCSKTLGPDRIFGKGVANALGLSPDDLKRQAAEGSLWLYCCEGWFTTALDLLIAAGFDPHAAMADRTLATRLFSRRHHVPASGG